MTDQLPDVKCDPAFVKLVDLLQVSAYSAGASGGAAGRDEMTEARKAIIDCYRVSQEDLRRTESARVAILAENTHYKAEVERLRINAAVDERLDRVERELMASEEHEELIRRLRSFGQAYPYDMFPALTSEERVKVGGDLISRISAAMGRHCSKIMAEAADALERAAQPPGDGQQ